MDADEKLLLRKYLLGSAGASKKERERIEKRLLLDENFFREVLLTEEELVDDYIEDALAPNERDAFEKNFLILKERRREVKFARALKRYAAEHRVGAIAERPRIFAGTSVPAKMRPGHFSALKFSRRAVASAAAGLAALLLVLFFAWEISFRARFSPSDSERAIAALNRAYRNERPLEARLAQLDYAPLGAVKRGADEKAATDAVERAAAERFSLDAVRNAPDSAAARQSLGGVYLLGGAFDKSIEQFELARRLEPQNAEIANDLGAAYLEKGRIVASDGKSGGRYELLTEALENFDAALKLRPDLPEARFNRADCLESLYMPNQAAEAWRAYLETDSASTWADEARTHLRALESNPVSEMSADELERTFLAAYRTGDEAAVLRLIKSNSELISGKYLPQRLIMSFVAEKAAEKPDEAEATEKLAALEFLGRLEAERRGDKFARDAANFYARVSSLPDGGEKILLLGRAQDEVKNGYRLCLEGDRFGEARAAFERARILFLKAGDDIEAESICQHFIAYCLYNTDRRREADALLQKIDDFCRRRNYKWFALMNFYWLTGSSESTGRASLTETRDAYESALEKAYTLGDAQLIQKFLLSLVLKNSFVRRRDETFFNLQKLFEFSNRPEVSVRQKFRNFNGTVEVAAWLDANGLSKAASLEAVSLADALADPLFAVGAETNAGIVHAQSADFAAARLWFERAESGARNLPDEARRSEELSRIFLKRGQMERAAGDAAAAIAFYDRSLQAAETLVTPAPALLYELKKSRLLAYQSVGDDEAVEREIPSVLRLADDFREKILDEQERHSFFDNEQTVYDVALEHEIRRGRIETGYDRAEASNARSLLDWLRRGSAAMIDKSGAARRAKILFNGNGARERAATPLKLSEIRERMPPRVRILQYAVLDNEVILWVISKEQTGFARVTVDAGELREKIEKYARLVETEPVGAGESISANQTEMREMSRELYRLLIEPALPFLDENEAVCIVPNKFLFRLPFASLVSSSSAAPSAGERERYFLEQFNFFYSPSANVFVAASENALAKTSAGEEKILSVGNPAFDNRRTPSLPDLPESKIEALQAAEDYGIGSKILTGPQATKEAFLAALPHFEVIHYAGHYQVEPGAPLLSTLVMAKSNKKSSDDDADAGSLSNFELLARKSLPRTKLAVLAACRTGAERYYNGEGAVGISRAFLSLGVPLVVASQWQVDSAATAQLMSRFHFYRRREKMSTASALRRAELELLLGAGNGEAAANKFQSPYYWAAFNVWGGYAEF